MKAKQKVRKVITKKVIVKKKVVAKPRIKVALKTSILRRIKKMVAKKKVIQPKIEKPKIIAVTKPSTTIKVEVAEPLIISTTQTVEDNNRYCAVCKEGVLERIKYGEYKCKKCGRGFSFYGG